MRPGRLRSYSHHRVQTVGNLSTVSCSPFRVKLMVSVPASAMTAPKEKKRTLRQNPELEERKTGRDPLHGHTGNATGGESFVKTERKLYKRVVIGFRWSIEIRIQIEDISYWGRSGNGEL